ncbi:hypothetical protein AAMO2058_000915400 [Amorphochlora amoebiformis]
MESRKRPREGNGGDGEKGNPKGKGGGSSKAMRMMKMMGFKIGTGLGREGQGRLEPVQESDQVSRQGLGFGSERREIRKELESNIEEDKKGVLEVKIELYPQWAPEDNDPVPTEFDTWLRVSHSGSMFEEDENLTIFRESPENGCPSGHYCRVCDDLIATAQNTPREVEDLYVAHTKTEKHQERIVVMCERYGSLQLQKKILKAKTRFDDIDDKTFRDARSRSNPFELIKKEGFQNRAALKMAEMDAMSNRLFTLNPLVKQQNKKLGPLRRQIVYFADICAGPGGFSEFMLTFLKWRSKGFGFTLKESNNFRLHKFNPSPLLSLRAYYGVDGTGDITNTKNIKQFYQNVMEETKGKGLHMVLADGGFSVRGGKENRQELLSQQLVLCQFLTALMVLQEGGTFVCKVFDTFLPFTVHCIYILKKHFKKFALVKPNQSRPANSERYVLCTGLKKERAPVVEYLMVLECIDNSKKIHQKIVGLVPEEMVKADKGFLTYLTEWNNINARRQIMSLNKVMRFILNPRLPSDDQHLIRRQCIEFWGLVPKPGSKRAYITMDSKDRQRLFHPYLKPHRMFNIEGPDGDTVAQIRDAIAEEEHKNRMEIDFASRSIGYEKHLSRAKRWMKRPKEWWCYRCPAGGCRYLLLATHRGCFLSKRGVNEFLRESGRSVHQGVPPDSILDVVMLDDKLIVLDAYCLGGDLNIWKRRFTERKALVEMFVESSRGGGIGLEFRQAKHLFETIDDKTIFHSNDPQDFYFFRDSPKPTPSIEFHMTHRSSMSVSAPINLLKLLQELRTLLHGIYAASKTRR